MQKERREGEVEKRRIRIQFKGIGNKSSAEFYTLLESNSNSNEDREVNHLQQTFITLWQ